MDETALKPEADELIGMDMSEVVENEAIGEAVESEKELASLLGSKGWQRISTKMQEDIDGLRMGTAVNMESADSLEEIGKKYMIAAALATKLQNYLDMVNNAARATAEYETRRNNKSA